MLMCVVSLFWLETFLLIFEEIFLGGSLFYIYLRNVLHPVYLFSRHVDHVLPFIL